MRRYAFVCMMLCAILLLVSCTGTDVPPLDSGMDTGTIKINNTDSYAKLITTEYSIDGFISAFTARNIYGQGTVAEIHSCMPIECLRWPDSGTLYSVHKIREGGLLYIFYDTHGLTQTNDIQDATVLRWFYVQKNLSSKEYSDAQTLNDVAEIDSAGKVFEEICYKDTERWSADGYKFASWHYVSDGIYEIAYEYKDGEWKIFDSRLLPDYSLENLYEPTSNECTAGILELDRIAE